METIDTSMSITVVNKLVSELRVYTFDFSTANEIINGDTISSIQSVTWTPTDGVLTNTTSTIAGTSVLAEFGSGTDGQRYTLYCKILTAAGYIITCPGYLFVTNYK